MLRLFLALALAALFAPHATADRSNAPLLALWEFDGWAKATPERPLGLRFVLLEDGSSRSAWERPVI